MSETPVVEPVVTPPTEPHSATAPAGTSGGVLWLWIVTLIAIVALCITGWQAYSNRQDIDGLRQELARRLTDVDAQSKAGRIAGDQLREATRDASVKIGLLEAKLAESQGQQIALEAMYQDLSRNRDEWAFAEIEQTLLMASQQLQLAGNVRAALIAVQAADARLQHMNRPQHAVLRKAIADDLARLKAAPHIDTAGLATRIDALIASVDELALAADTRPASAPAATVASAAPVGESTWSRFWREVWGDLRQLARVQRIESADVPLLTPSQVFFLRENLKLRLLTARMALLARDQLTFRNDLREAAGWLKRYFDMRDKTVVSAGSALATLQSSEVSIELPDLSATLAALRAVPATAARGR